PLAGPQGGGLEYEKRHEVEPVAAEDNLEVVGHALRRAFGRHADADWIVNLSGGTKPMSIAAYEFFKAVGARLVYVNVRQPNELIGLDGRPTETCRYRPSVNEFLAGYGFGPRKKEAKVREGEEFARRTWECARQIAAGCPSRGILCFGDLSEKDLQKRWDDARKKGFQTGPEHWGNLPGEVLDAIARTFALKTEGGVPSGWLDKYAVDFLTGGWLEVFLWGILERHANALGIWDVHRSLEFGKFDIDTKNEFDVAFMHQYRLAVVECKSGAQSHDPEVDAIHKLEAVVRQFRALSVSAYLATTSPHVLDKDGHLKPSVRDRAAVYGSRILCRGDIERLAADPDSVDLVQDLFFGRRETA
ncbi:MAG: DUF1887 family protein, partial [Thermoguttaceae bacterium]|nr:DUF1887 family protein [Thermoguttaceae bacterium]